MSLSFLTISRWMLTTLEQMYGGPKPSFGLHVSSDSL